MSEWTYQCHICGQKLTAITPENLYELIFIHMRGHWIEEKE
jgi:hypothetical protein